MILGLLRCYFFFLFFFFFKKKICHYSFQSETQQTLAFKEPESWASKSFGPQLGTKSI